MLNESLIGVLWRKVAADPTNAVTWRELARTYAVEGMTWQASYSAHKSLRLMPTLLPDLEALAIDRWKDVSAGDAQLGRADLVDAHGLALRFATWVEKAPDDWLSLLYLTRLKEIMGADDALLLEKVCTLEPISGESLHCMGVWRLNAGDAQLAVTAFSDLLDIRPLRHGSMMYLGEALQRLGNIAAAQKAFERATLSNNPDFLILLAGRVYAYNYWQEAIEVLKKALSIRSDSVIALLALAKIESEVYALADCRKTLAKLRILVPENTDVSLLEAGLHGRIGDAASHLVTLQSAYADGADPLSRLASSIAMTSLYQDDLTAIAIADLHRKLCAPIEAAVQRRTDFSNTKQADRRLRLGFVTGDLHRQHPVNIFMLPVLLRLDHVGFEVFLYHTGIIHDEYTRQAQGCADKWVEAATLDDNALQQVIVADAIDLLIDLGGHTSTHRLGVFALRAAPVQATFLGYPHSTGLSAIDWLIGDAVVSPAEHVHLFSEGIAQLPASVFCWAPVDEYPLPAPREPGKPLRLGSFNNAMKLTPRTLALWSRVLHALPGSELLLKAPSLHNSEVRARFTALFEAQGIGAERLVFSGPSGLADMMQEYREIDIALDPTPYNGGTTTLQALWMGVPVVVLAGSNFVSRMGASFLGTLGRPDWVAQDEDDYIAAVVNLARDMSGLRGGRAALRAAMKDSQLCRVDTYVQALESLLHRMWVQYTAGESGRLLLAEAGDG